MKNVLVVIALLLAALFAVSSISQSYSAAQQAQAAIEASRNAQIASLGNLLMLGLVFVLGMALVFALAALGWLYFQFKIKPALPGNQTNWAPGPNARWQKTLPETNANPNEMLPALMSMMMLQIIQQQQAQRLALPQQPGQPVESGHRDDDLLDNDFWNLQ